MKKMMMLATMVAAVMAFALPATSSAAWNDEGTAITSTKTVQLTGSASHSGGVECPNALTDLTLDPGSTGKIDTFTIEETDKCKVIGSLAALGCNKLTSHISTNLPWSISTNGSVILITKIDLDLTYVGSGLCVSGVGTTLSNKLDGSGKEIPLVATPNSTTTVSSVKLSGELKSSTGTNVTTSGTLSVLSPNTGTYGI